MSRQKKNTSARAPRSALPDPRLSCLDALVDSFRNLQVTPENPLRPGFGTVSTSFNLKANFFALKLPQKMLLHDYEVKIEQEKDVRALDKARIFELLEGSPECVPYTSSIAHDSSQRIVSTEELPQPLIINLTYYDRGQTQPLQGAPTYTVTIAFIHLLNFDDIMK